MTKDLYLQPTLWLSCQCVSPAVIGIALLCAGWMDGFHTLAADRLMEGIADTQNLVPFTWALCRLFNALLIILGISLFLTRREDTKIRGNTAFVVGTTFGFFFFANIVIQLCARSNFLPQTMFPSAFITRPWDMGPLILFLFAGFFLCPRFYHKHPTLFSHSLIVATVPNVATQLYMAFGSTALFDNAFNVAHFLKIIAYLVPLAGLIFDYIYTHADLERSNQTLSLEIRERKEAEQSLRESKAELQNKTQKLQSTLSELKQAQTQIIQSEKMSSLGQLVGGIAHEVNNPVNFIYGNVSHTQEMVQDLFDLIQLYQQVCSADHPEIQEKLEEIELEFVEEDLPKILTSMKTGCTRIQKIVESLRSFSRLDEAEIKTVNLHENLDAALLLISSRLKKIQVLKKYDDQLPLIECFPAQLNQVWMHLLTNSVDSLTDAEVFDPSIWLNTARMGNEMIRVQIIDNGPGIPEAVQERIFDPFFTTKPVGQGTGMGLAVCYSIVKQHQGKISVYSVAYQETTFTVELPCVLAKEKQ
ncbi:MAG: ATP-binding protein [Microcoleaceae cyanobacterium]